MNTHRVDRRPARRPRRLRAGGKSAKASRRQSGPAAAEAPAAQLTPPLLSERQRKHLRGLAHELNPVIRLGNAGLTEAVAAETGRALRDHELIKVKVPGGGDRETRDAVFAELAQRTASALVHRIGNVAVLYRPRSDVPRIVIPD